MTIREIINQLEDNIIQLKEEVVKLREELAKEKEEKMALARELHTLKRKQTRQDMKSYIAPEVTVSDAQKELVADNGDSDTPVVEEVPEKPKRSRRKKEVIEEVVE